MSANERASNSYVKHNISHIRQRFNWDCGIACVLMLLSEQQRKEFIEGFSRICLEEGFGHATWTIDLCYLLKRRIFGGSYRGHYILVVDWAGGRLRYHNPARAHPLCATTRKNLRVARTPPHTDCDVILVYNQYK